MVNLLKEFWVTSYKTDKLAFLSRSIFGSGNNSRFMAVDLYLSRPGHENGVPTISTRIKHTSVGVIPQKDNLDLRIGVMVYYNECDRKF